MLRIFFLSLTCLFSFQLFSGTFNGRLCLEKYREFQTKINSDQREWAKYERIVNFLAELDKLRALIFPDEPSPSKESFADSFKYFPLQQHDIYNKFLDSALFVQFSNNKVETEKEIVKALLFEYLFGSLLSGERGSGFKPITFLYLKTHLHIPPQE